MGKSDWERQKEEIKSAYDPEEARASYLKNVTEKFSEFTARASEPGCSGLVCFFTRCLTSESMGKAEGELWIEGELGPYDLKSVLKALEKASGHIKGLIAQMEKEESGRKWN